jgi:hypothetical protein
LLKLVLACFDLPRSLPARHPHTLALSLNALSALRQGGFDEAELVINVADQTASVGRSL